jgi:hypothetical protein
MAQVGNVSTTSAGVPDVKNPARPTPSARGAAPVARGFNLTSGDTPAHGQWSASDVHGIGDEKLGVSKVPMKHDTSSGLTKAFRSLRPAPGSPWGSDATGKSGVLSDDQRLGGSGTGQDGSGRPPAAPQKA